MKPSAYWLPTSWDTPEHERKRLKEMCEGIYHELKKEKPKTQFK